MADAPHPATQAFEDTTGAWDLPEDRSSSMPLFGDIYGEPEVMREIRLNWSAAEWDEMPSSFFEHFEHLEPCLRREKAEDLDEGAAAEISDDEDAPPPKPCFADFVNTEVHSAAVPDAFPSIITPPRLSVCPFSMLQPTTVEVYTADPAGFANAVLEFASCYIPTEQIITNSQKCSISIEASTNAGDCSFGFQMYEVGARKYLLEAQRQRGDVVLFVLLFEGLLSFLTAHGFDVRIH